MLWPIKLNKRIEIYKFPDQIKTPAATGMKKFRINLIDTLAISCDHRETILNIS
jgi:hypothetical protein